MLGDPTGMLDKLRDWLFGRFLRRLDLPARPRIELSAPFDRAIEDYFVWWHVSAQNGSHSRWKPAASGYGVVNLYVSRQSGPSARIEGVWASRENSGPVRRIYLEKDGDAEVIPVAVMANVDVLPHDLVNPPYAKLSRNVCHITGVRHAWVSG